MPASSTLPRIVFCITCKGRVQHLEQTLPKNLSDNADYPNFKIVVLDYGSPDHLLRYLSCKHTADIASGRLAVYGYYEWTGGFRMAHAKNMAHRCGVLEGADILVNMDADNWAAPGFAQWIADQFREFGLELGFLWADAKSVVGRARQGLAGRAAVSRNLFLKLGGYDEKYVDWAPEDEDFKSRAKRLLGVEGVKIPEKFLYVLPHKDGLRFKDYPHAKPTPESEAEAIRVIRDSDATIANFGKFGMGNVCRNFSHKNWAEFGPFPTRIFGIGMPKTATTSLHHALLTLGLDSAHWTRPQWAKEIWLEMRESRSITLERHYALSDLPVPLFYRELDSAYPGSKFILTVRNEEKWIRSVERHWDCTINPFRASWDTEPAKFSHRIHRDLYGQKHFDAEVFTARYRRHNAEVREYFKDRPKDLLVMEMDKGDGWNVLCPFLGMPVPDDKYPVAFTTQPSAAEFIAAGI